eukprot:GHUV01001191.1.p1 GENE.GHUV01001191.1~~GHUV01001191.1.p1  ORF type:complete len:955 (+),score=181.63 GHUV01001191.1:310-2865(+)
MTLDSPVLTQNGQKITVSWSGIPTVAIANGTTIMHSDTIALVQSSDAFGTRYPIKYVWAKQASPDTYLQGLGSASFWVVNHRQDLKFLYLRYPADAKDPRQYAWGQQQELASVTLKVGDVLKKAPSQLRISIRPKGYRSTDTSYSIQVAWQSTIPGGLAAVSSSASAIAKYRKWLSLNIGTASVSPDTLSKEPYFKWLNIAQATSETYTAADMCGFPANSAGFLDPGYTNSAVWASLEPNTKYYYLVGSLGSGYSEIKRFTTPPLTDADCYSSPRGWASATASPDSSGTTPTDLSTTGTADPSTFKPWRCRPKECKCLRNNVAPLKILLAADVGTNNNQDATWSADGQGFSVINAAQVANTNINGPFYPGRTYTTPPIGAPPAKLDIPISNSFYLLYTVGDFPTWGQQPASYNVIKEFNRLAATGRYHSAFIVGDIAYAEGVSAHWDMYLSNIEPTMSSIPTMYSNGNHESAGPGLPDSAMAVDVEATIPDGGGECGKVYERRLKMPFASGVSLDKRPEYYSYIMGPMAVVVLSTEQNYNISSTQYNWLKAELQSISALRAQGRIPWLVVAFHRPMYVDDPDVSNGIGNQWVASVLQSQLESLFAQYQVDMTWTGHTHFYHRSCKVFKGGCRPDAKAPDGSVISAPVHVMVGNGGFQPGAIVFETKPEWIEKETFNYGYCTLEVTQTALGMQCFDATTGKKFDETKLTKSPKWRPNPTAAAANYVTMNTVLMPPGINVTAELGPIVEFVKENLGALELLIGGDAQALIGYINSVWGPGTPIDSILNAVPGSKNFSMAQVSPMYLGVLTLIQKIFNLIPPGIAVPGTEEVAYAIKVNSPGGRLYNMLYGGSG